MILLNLSQPHIKDTICVRYYFSVSTEQRESICLHVEQSRYFQKDASEELQ